MIFLKIDINPGVIHELITTAIEQTRNSLNKTYAPHGQQQWFGLHGNVHMGCSVLIKEKLMCMICILRSMSRKKLTELNFSTAAETLCPRSGWGSHQLEV